MSISGVPLYCDKWRNNGKWLGDRLNEGGVRTARDRHREGDTCRQRETDTERERHAGSERQTQKGRDMQAARDRHRAGDMQAAKDTQRGRHAGSERQTQRGRDMHYAGSERVREGESERKSAPNKDN